MRNPAPSSHDLTPPQVHLGTPKHFDHIPPESRLAQEKALVRKIDVRLLPVLFLMFILNYIDRNALPQARRQGLEVDLGLVGNQYNTVLSLTFIGYILGQIPSNMIMSHVRRPSLYLCGAMITWGVISGASGATHHFTDIAVCRLLLGICEAPFFPGVCFLFSGWYTRKELGKRLAIFFSGSMIAGAFGGIFAAGIATAFKDSSIDTWRWMFIIEGSVTVLFAISIAFIIPDWPATTKWLSVEEKALAETRLRDDAGEEDETNVTTVRGLLLALRDYRVWLCVIGQMSMQAVASLTNFLPTLVAEFGRGEVATLLLTAPPYVAAAVYAIIACFWSDRLSKRSSFIIFPTIAAMVGIIATLATANAAVRYAALFLMLPGTYGCFQISNAWMANIAARPAKKRGIALAMNNGLGSSALVWTPYLYDAQMGPRYTVAWSVNLGLLVVLLASTIALSSLLHRANKQLQRGNAEVILVENQAGDQDKARPQGHWWSASTQRMVATVAEGEGNGRVLNRFDT